MLAQITADKERTGILKMHCNVRLLWLTLTRESHDDVGKYGIPLAASTKSFSKILITQSSFVMLVTNDESIMFMFLCTCLEISFFFSLSCNCPKVHFQFSRLNNQCPKLKFFFSFYVTNSFSHKLFIINYAR